MLSQLHAPRRIYAQRLNEQAGTPSVIVSMLWRLQVWPEHDRELIRLSRLLVGLGVFFSLAPVVGEPRPPGWLGVQGLSPIFEQAVGAWEILCSPRVPTAWLGDGDAHLNDLWEGSFC